MPQRFGRSAPFAASALLAAIAACSDGAGPSGTPAALAKVAGDNITAPVAQAVPEVPTVEVRTSGGAPVRNAVVTFAAADTQSGVVAGPTVRTDADGRAAPVGWTLGRRSGTQRVVAKVEGVADSVVFSVRARANGAFRFEIASPAALRGRVRQLPDTLPAVRVVDIFGNPVAGDSVAWQVDTTGLGTQGGTVNNLFVTRLATDSLGVSRAPWRLGRRAGRQTIRAQFNLTTPPILFEATATPEVATRLVVTGAQSTTVNPTLRYPEFPRFTVSDEFGNGVPGEVVRFSLEDAGGSLDQLVDTTDANGIANPGAWTVGPNTGTKRVRAVLGRDTTTTAVFTATAVATGTSQFTITLRYSGTFLPEVQAAFESAKARWEQIIIGDLQDIQVLSAVNCNFGGTIFTLGAGAVVDDIVIDAAIVPIDGAGSVLGSAGWCFRRDGTTGLPIFGAMRFDQADMPGLIANGRLEDVILHEMGHVLGIGTLWQTQNLLVNPVPPPCESPGTDTRFLGAQAIGRYQAAGSFESTIPVENRNGCGTANGHWRENVFTRELMTGFLNSGVTNPLSPMTIASLADLGYVVSYATAEPCTGFAQCYAAEPAGVGGPLIDIHGGKPMEQPILISGPPKLRPIAPKK